MASPLSSVPKTTRAIRESLKNNCWATMLATKGSYNQRIYGARTKRGVLQVETPTGEWLAITADHTIYQS